MKAIRVSAWGGPDVLRYEDASDPVLAEGDVLVKVRAAGVNPVDWKIRQGHLKHLPHQPPFVLGWDLSGVVARSGHGFVEGDEVYARPDIARPGCYAELVAVRATELAKKPRSLAHVHAAAVPLAALTAWQMLFDAPAKFTSLKLEKGQTILVHAGAGGVGSFAIQLAKHAGARVIATASGKNVDFVKSIGADELVDYTKHDFASVVKNVDAVFDTVGGDVPARSWACLKEGGVLGSITSKPEPPAGKRAAYVFVQPNAAQLATIAQLIDDGAVSPQVGAILPLRDAKRANELSETGHARGKIVLEV
jgi:NADPH:quinone reductase-like Zn-dependent oxidoreductase